MAAREVLETAVRRTLSFHLGATGDTADDRELLVSALLDAAESGTLCAMEDVERDFEDYFPDATLNLSPSAQGEIYDDILRDALKHFPLEPKAEGDEEDGSGGDDMDPGCCLLCERLMPLTRHHVMPRSTHKRYRKKGYTEDVLKRTIDICRPCHSAIHRTHDALTLAERFTTREALLGDESISRFVAWARKQRVTSKADANNNLLHYRR